MPGSHRRWVLLSALVALCAFLVGPRLEFRLIAPEGLFAKRSLIEVLHQPFGQTAGLTLTATGVVASNGEAELVSCVSERGWMKLFFAKTRELDSASTPDSIESRAPWADACKSESDAALASGAAPEAMLQKGDVAAYLAHVAAKGGRRLVGVGIDTLPPALSASLLALLPQTLRAKYLPFDVALATGSKAHAQALLPAMAEVKPYQRHALFGLGMAALLDGVPGKTADSIAEERAQTAQTMLQVGMRAGSADMVRSLLLAGMGGGMGREGFTGGYSDHDYYYANRTCDQPYAEFLTALGLRPQGVQLMHLLSSVGLAQFPGHDPQQFKHAEPTFGHPVGDQLVRCPALARWYAERVPLQAASEIDALYEHIGDARLAWIRSRNKTAPVPGGLGLSTAVAVAMLERLPPSFPQYCAWTNTAFWSLLEPAEDEGTVVLDALLRLQASWKEREWVDLPLAGKPNSLGEPGFGETDSHGNPLPLNCPLLQMGFVNRPNQVLALLNQRLTQLGVPCQGQARPNNPGVATPKLPLLICRKS